MSNANVNCLRFRQIDFLKLGTENDLGPIMLVQEQTDKLAWLANILLPAVISTYEYNKNTIAVHSSRRKPIQEWASVDDLAFCVLMYENYIPKWEELVARTKREKEPAAGTDERKELDTLCLYSGGNKLSERIS